MERRKVSRSSRRLERHITILRHIPGFAPDEVYGWEPRHFDGGMSKFHLRVFPLMHLNASHIFLSGNESVRVAEPDRHRRNTPASCAAEDIFAFTSKNIRRGDSGQPISSIDTPPASFVNGLHTPSRRQYRGQRRYDSWYLAGRRTGPRSGKGL